MKMIVMGSVPTYEREETRDLSDQEKPFAAACREIGYEAARCGHTILASDDHPASADFHVIQGLTQYANESPGHKASIQVHRAEGSGLIYDSLPVQVTVTRKFHPDFGHAWRGTLIPNLAALESGDVLVLIGGGMTVKLMGQIAADKERPVLAIPSFGGTSVEMFESLKWIHRGRLGDRFNDLVMLKSTWSAGFAERVIGLAADLTSHETVIPPHSYFISYKWEDSGVADHIEVLLCRKKRVVHRDESIFNAGIDLSDGVKSLINESDTFIGLWNANYKDSSWCPQELEYALNRQHQGLKPSRVVLLMLDETEPPIRFVNRLRQDARDRTQRELSVRKLVEQETSL
jgi:hypothetical protein